MSKNEQRLTRKIQYFLIFNARHALYKALHELERMQATRLGEKIPLPVAVDVTIDHES